MAWASARVQGGDISDYSSQVGNGVVLDDDNDIMGGGGALNELV